MEKPNQIGSLFTDVEGCFFVRLTKPTLKRKSEIQFSLSQSEKQTVVFIRDLILQEIGIKAKHPTYLISENKAYDELSNNY